MLMSMAMVNARSKVWGVITGEKLTEDGDGPKPELLLPKPDEPPLEKPPRAAGDDADGAAEAVGLCEERIAILVFHECTQV